MVATHPNSLREQERVLVSSRLRATVSLVLGIGLICALLVASPAPASAATVQDQINPGPSNGQLGARADRRLAQIFRAGTTGELNRITLTGCDLQDNIVDVNIWIYDASSTPPNAIPSGSPSAFIGAANISGSELSIIPSSSGCSTAFDVVLDSPAYITAGNLYAFVVSATKTGDQTIGGLRLLQSAGATYSAGNKAESTNAGSSWTPDDRNFLFTTYVDIGSPSPDPILQQFGKPASGTCTDTAPPHTQLPGAPSGGWGESWAQWVNDGNGGAVCTRTLIYRTALSRWIVD